MTTRMQALTTPLTPPAIAPALKVPEHKAADALWVVVVVFVVVVGDGVTDVLGAVVVFVAVVVELKYHT
jgi:hypothetical protein